VADPDQAFGGQSNKGAPKYLNLFKYPSFSATIVGYHTEVITFSKPRKWLYFLVELCDLSGNHHSLKSPFLFNSESLKQTSYVMWLFRGMLYIIPNHHIFVNMFFHQWQNFFTGRSLETLDLANKLRIVLLVAYFANHAKFVFSWPAWAVDGLHLQQKDQDKPYSHQSLLPGA